MADECSLESRRGLVTDKYRDVSLIWPRGYKTIVMLNSAEHEISSANRYENANRINFHAQLSIARKNVQN